MTINTIMAYNVLILNNVKQHLFKFNRWIQPISRKTFKVITQQTRKGNRISFRDNRSKVIPNKQKKKWRTQNMLLLSSAM